MSYTAIASQTLATSATSVTFSSLPQGFRDLILIGNYDIGGANTLLRFNGDSGNNYNSTRMFNAGFAGSGAQSSAANLVLDIGMSGRASMILQIIDYSQTNKQKSTLNRNDADTVTATFGLWASASAITSLQIYGGTFTAGSTFSLYGVSA